MLAGFRSFAKSPFAVLLFGLLIVSFAIFGISDVFKGPQGSGVISAGSRSLSPQDFKARFDNYRKAMEQRTGESITPDQAVERGIDRQIVQELTLQESIAAAINKMGVAPSDKLVSNIVHEQMSQLPAGQRPFNPITGKFDPQAYAALLAQNNLTPAAYEAALRDEIANAHFFSAVAQGMKAPRIYGALQGAYILETRDVAAFAVNPASVEKPAPPTDDQLTAFMKENAEKLTRPETRVLSIMRVSAKALEPSVAINPADVQKAFDFRKDSLAKPETRSLVQIVAPDAKAAATISLRLAKGEDPAAVAKAFGKTPLVLTDKPKTAIPDRKVADAAFALTAGQVSPPITGELGVSVVKLTKVTPGVVATLDSVRPQIEAEVRAQTAQSKAYDQTQAYQDAHDGGADLVAAASKAGALVVTTAPITAQGVDMVGQPIPGLTPDILKTAFELSQGGESELVEVGKGEYYAVKAEKIFPAALPPLAEIKPQLTAVWMGQEMAKRMKAKAEALSARVKKGESLEAVAAASQSNVQKVAGLSRQNAQKYMGLGQEFLGAAFGAKANDVFIARAGPQGEAYVVAKMEAIHPAPTASVAQIAAIAGAQAGNGLMRDLGEASRNAAKTQLKTKSNLTLARQAIGVDTEALAKAQGGKAGGDKAGKKAE
jgi:peptidyl-prolyl cis-trans isomerase D